MKLVKNNGKIVVFRHHDHFRQAVSKGHPRRIILEVVGSFAHLTVLAKEGRLTITYPSVAAMKKALANWRSLEGIPMIVNGKKRGCVSRNNPELIA